VFGRDERGLVRLERNHLGFCFVQLVDCGKRPRFDSSNYREDRRVFGNH
jgi:hypothetical protein